MSKEGSSSRRRGGTFLIILGLLLVLAAGGLTAYNRWDSDRAAKESARILNELEDLIPDDLEEGAAAPPVATAADYEMPTKMIDGYEYIGRIIIPSLEIDLPVMKEWDYERLQISPCRFTGSYKMDDMVICAHNFDSHFSPIKWIDIGVDVEFISVDGIVYKYIVSNRETVQPTSVKEMIENDNNSKSKADWDLTLFTCNTGGQTRCAVRCVRKMHASQQEETGK